MCGIFGLIQAPGSSLNEAQTRALVEGLYELSQSRGKEASGLAVKSRAAIDLAKAPIGASEFIKRPVIRSLLAGALMQPSRDGEPLVLMGHARMVTNGGAHQHDNNQPVVRGDLTCIHNGIIVNDAQIWERHPDLHRKFEVDTEAFLALVAKGENAGLSLPASVRAAFRECVGANSIALMSGRTEALTLGTTNGSLFWTVGTSGREAIFASERFILETIIGHAEDGGFSADRIEQIQPGYGVVVDPRSLAFEHFSLVGEGELPAILSNHSPCEVRDHLIEADQPLPFAGQSAVGEVEDLLKIDLPKIRALRRCTRCVLPETFPFIAYDADGVCNFCQNHRPLKLRGKSALLSDLGVSSEAQAGNARVLVPLSGGRDSCYGIHYAVKDLGLKPVAYTYDWGMVTDLARRNISRMCGALKIEHVLVSANIRQKRDFISKNVSAWLKSPHLGAIPLFMAGDKQFFYYANLLKKQMRLDSILFSMNPLERTDFKVGFCGINENYIKEIHYNPSLFNKIRLAAFFGGQFLKNPAYLNQSLVDSFSAYISYYFIDRGYLSIFNYIPWEESKIEDTLIGEYDWEISPDTKSTWRIGDGTASFYNYIYYRVAGFTENDTFRSNQIREGLISREQAMASLEEDNRPRAQSIREYCSLIGLSAADALRVINRMPTLY